MLSLCVYLDLNYLKLPLNPSISIYLLTYLFMVIVKSFFLLCKYQVCLERTAFYIPFKSLLRTIRLLGILNRGHRKGSDRHLIHSKIEAHMDSRFALDFWKSPGLWVCASVTKNSFSDPSTTSARFFMISIWCIWSDIIICLSNLS